MQQNELKKTADRRWRERVAESEIVPIQHIFVSISGQGI